MPKSLTRISAAPRAVVQDRAMVLHHPARRAARAAGVDQAGYIVARHGEAMRFRFVPMRFAAGDQRRPVVDRDLALPADAHRLPADDRSEERAAGTDCGRTWRLWWSLDL